MAITRSAKKALRSSARKRIFNLRRRDAAFRTSKAFLKAAAAGDRTKAEKLLPAAYRAIDKAMKRGVMKKNTAARKKSQLALALKRTHS